MPSPIEPSTLKRAGHGSAFVEPSLCPADGAQPSPVRRSIGVICLGAGFVAIFFGGSSIVGQFFLIGGSVLIAASLFAFAHLDSPHVALRRITIFGNFIARPRLSRVMQQTPVRRMLKILMTQTSTLTAGARSPAVILILFSLG